MQILIYFNRRARRHIVRNDETQEVLAECETFQGAKDWIELNQQGAEVHHAGPGGIRALRWQQRCKHCGRAFDPPFLK